MYAQPGSGSWKTRAETAVATGEGGPVLRGMLSRNEPMADHTSWRAGGAAARFYVPADLDDLSRFLATAETDEPLLWLGLGSNLLVRDGGFEGTVVAISGVLSGLESDGGRRVRAAAGVACAKVARFCARCSLSGAEFLAGIPGTVGGALAMNAGAFGAETWDMVRSVEIMDRRGRRRRRERSDYEIGYRHVQAPPDEWFIAAEFELQPDAAGTSDARIRELLARRAETQPTGVFSCGSVFRNPPGDFAGRLIESCGMKGMRVGRACVSDRHANFIVNEGGATAAEIEELMLLVQQEVQRRAGVRLEPEVRIVGSPAVKRSHVR
jgi:UDP-N-acetylmuramate dehydrogenase